MVAQLSRATLWQQIACPGGTPERPMATTCERFTDEARRALELAYEEARRQDHPYIGTEHLLVGLMAEPTGVAGDALAELGLGVSGARQQLVFIIGRGLPTDARPGRLSPRAQVALA